MGKITKKRNDLKFCNDLPCNDLYVSTVQDFLRLTINRPRAVKTAVKKLLQYI